VHGGAFDLLLCSAGRLYLRAAEGYTKRARKVMGRQKIASNEQLVREYFRCLAKDSDYTIELFTNDATIYEPFSKEQRIQGKEAIRYFLKVARMANKGLVRKIDILFNEKDRIEVRVSFARGDTIDGKFQFLTEDFKSPSGTTEKRIKELRIRFDDRSRKKNVSHI
jgi:transport factor 2 (NTF2)-like protein